MTRNAKMATEGTFEPCEKGTNDPAVQRSFSMWSVSSLNMCSLLSKLVNANNDCLSIE